MPVTTRYASMGVFDIEGFGRRSAFLQKALRRRLREVVFAALADAGLDRTSAVIDIVDRGDGFALLVDPVVAKETLTVRFVDALVEQLRRHELQSSPSGRIRLKLVLHAGEVTLDDSDGPEPGQRGWSGIELNTACRLVDFPLLGKVLAAAPAAYLAVGLSDSWHRDVVGGDWVDGRSYRAASIQVKEVSETVHIRIPGSENLSWSSSFGEDPMAEPASEAARTPAETPPGPGPVSAQEHPGQQASANLIQIHSGSGDTVGGDKNVTVQRNVNNHG